MRIKFFIHKYIFFLTLNLKYFGNFDSSFANLQEKSLFSRVIFSSFFKHMIKQIVEHNLQGAPGLDVLMN